MNRREIAWAVATVATVLLAGAADRLIVTPSDRHAVIFTALTATTAGLTWHVTRRFDLAWVAAATVGAWAIPHATFRRDLLLAFVPAALIALPGRTFEDVPRWAPAMLAALVAGAVMLWLTGSPAATGLASVVAGAGTWVRPGVPTEGTIGAMWSSALFLPGVVLIGLVPVNAATDWFEAPTAEQALWIGLALLGTLLLFSLATLGLSTLVESDDPAQATIWVASLVALGIVAGSLATKDLVILRTSVAIAAAPVGLLVAIVAGRAASASPAQRYLVLPIPAILSLLTLGFG